MNVTAIITYSQIPNNKEVAKSIKEKIDQGILIAHPDDEERINKKISQIISGIHHPEPIKKSEDTLIDEANFWGNYEEVDLILYPDEKLIAELSRQEDRDLIINEINNALISLNRAERETTTRSFKYKYRLELARAKIALLTIQDGLEQDSIAAEHLVALGKRRKLNEAQ